MDEKPINRDVAFSRALIEGIARRNGGALHTTNLARIIRESLTEAARELDITDLEEYLGNDDTRGYGKFTYNTTSRIFLNSADDSGIRLAETEGRVFSPIFTAAPNLVTHDLLRSSLGEEYSYETVKTRIYLIRKKLFRVSPDAAIRTVHSAGYLFQDLSLSRSLV